MWVIFGNLNITIGSWEKLGNVKRAWSIWLCLVLHLSLPPVQTVSDSPCDQPINQPYSPYPSLCQFIFLLIYLIHSTYLFYLPLKLQSYIRLSKALESSDHSWGRFKYRLLRVVLCRLSGSIFFAWSTDRWVLILHRVSLRWSCSTQPRGPGAATPGPVACRLTQGDKELLIGYNVGRMLI